MPEVDLNALLLDEFGGPAAHIKHRYAQPDELYGCLINIKNPRQQSKNFPGKVYSQITSL